MRSQCGHLLDWVSSRWVGEREMWGTQWLYTSGERAKSTGAGRYGSGSGGEGRWGAVGIGCKRVPIGSD